ncbi:MULTISPECIES: hypothetical protein, partial [unclassified Halorhodospira]|uniref:hypothetical protein n=1 Tax=unclassified Halorhodospira TaxID=2626748 RepID=UPI001EE7DB44
QKDAPLAASSDLEVGWTEIIQPALIGESTGYEHRHGYQAVSDVNRRACAENVSLRQDSNGVDSTPHTIRMRSTSTGA